MQNTRLTTLISNNLTKFSRFTTNPWRRISLVIIGFLLGNFLGSVVITTAGQGAIWDVIAALILVIFTEIVNIFVYRRSISKTSSSEVDLSIVFPEILNSLKIGITYSLFMDAFKLGS